MLDVLSETRTPTLTSASFLRRWREFGAFQVDRVSSPKLITLIGSKSDFTEALLGDAERWLDAASQMQASLFNAFDKKQSQSPGWAIVTVYYFGFFSALATTRLLGSTIVYTSIDEDKRFWSVLGNAGNGLRGSVEIKWLLDQSISQSEIQIRKCSRSHMHEAVWVTTQQALGEWSHVGKSKLTFTDEDRLFDSLGKGSSVLKFYWSDFRNCINYRPEVGFDFSKSISAIFTSIDSASFDTYPEAIQSYSSLIGKLTKDDILLASPSAVLGLWLHSCLQYALARALYMELQGRIKIDPRWNTRRSLFLKRHGLTTNPNWPIRDTLL